MSESEKTPYYEHAKEGTCGPRRQPEKSWKEASRIIRNLESNLWHISHNVWCTCTHVHYVCTIQGKELGNNLKFYVKHVHLSVYLWLNLVPCCFSYTIESLFSCYCVLRYDSYNYGYCILYLGLLGWSVPNSGDVHCLPWPKPLLWCTSLGRKYLTQHSRVPEEFLLSVNTGIHCRCLVHFHWLKDPNIRGMSVTNQLYSPFL